MEYKFLEVPDTEWFRMTKQQREKHIQKVANVKLKYEGNVEEADLSRSTSLSISAEEFHSGDLKIPLNSIQGIWRKAEELLVQEDAIVSAPGYPKGSKMVKSTSGKRPHLVKCGKGGRFSCDSDCPNWKALGICYTVLPLHKLMHV